jgi:hypothetical protein
MGMLKYNIKKRNDPFPCTICQQGLATCNNLLHCSLLVVDYVIRLDILFTNIAPKPTSLVHYRPYYEDIQSN